MIQNEWSANAKQPLTIGVLVSGILDDFTQHICNGILSEAKLRGVNTLILPGKYMDRDLSADRELMYEYQYGTVFSYIEQGCVDALIVAADCIGCFTTQDRIRQLLESFLGIPTVLIASRLDGYPCVTFQNAPGIREGLSFLIESCGHTKIGMLGGSVYNTDATERYTVFREVLSSHGLDCPKERFASGRLSDESPEFYNAYLDANPDLEAIFCVNDNIALGLYPELLRRGLLPGRDISVMGFDNLPAGAKAIPSLSTVFADPIQLGEASLRSVLSLLAGESVKDVQIPTHFVLRDSIVRNAAGQKTAAQILSGLDVSFRDIFYRNQVAESPLSLEDVKSSFARLFDYLVAYFSRRGDNSVSTDDIERTFELFLNQDVVGITDMDGLLLLFEQLQQSLLQYQKNDAECLELRTLFSIIFKNIIRAMNRQSASVLQQEYQTSYNMKLIVQNILQFEHGDEASFLSVLDNLGWLGIHNAYLCLLPKPVTHLFQEPFATQETLLLKAVRQKDVVHPVPLMEQKKSLFQLHQFVKQSSLTASVSSNILLPLFFGKTLYGILICDMVPSLFINGEFLVNQLSSAIKMITLLRANEHIQAQLESHVATLQDHNDELDAIAKSDPLTGILNLRGFYALGEERLARMKKAGRHQTVIYVDMNYLKPINDHFGHNEGDSSLAQIAQVLVSLISDGRGIAGRIGGDEFACLIDTLTDHCADEIITALYEKFNHYNETSKKPYLLTVSAGACPILPESDISLKDALIQADNRLYEVKKARSMAHPFR